MRHSDDKAKAGTGRTLRWAPVEEWAQEREPDWLVGRLLARRAVSALVGEPFAGKSWLASYLAVSVAAGTDFFGGSVRPGPVIYMAGEREVVTRRRIGAEFHARSLAGLPLVTVSTRMNIGKPESAASLGQAVQEISDHYRQPPALIIFDTLARFALGVDENAAGAMGAVMGALTDLAERTGAHVMVLHHVDKGRNMPRGSTAITGAVDAVLRLGSDRFSRWFEMSEANDGEPSGRFRFAIEDGRLIESERREAPPPTGGRAKLSPDVAAVLQALRKAPSPITLSCFEDIANDALTGVKQRDARSLRQARFNARRTLSEAGHIAISGDSVSVSKTSASVSETVSADTGETSAECVSKHPPYMGDADAADARQQWQS